MATRIVAGSTPASVRPAEGAQTDDLLITIWPDELARYTGSRAQLEAEGLIPPDFKLPEGKEWVYWSADGYDYQLRRVRPEGFKGPQRAWLGVDNWIVDVRVTGRDLQWRKNRAIERKVEDLKDAIHRQSKAGWEEGRLRLEAFCETLGDKAFQRFKAIVVPERKRRGRPVREASPAAEGVSHG